MNKKRIAIGSLIILAVLLVAGGTMAWFTSNKKASSSLTTGNVKIEVNKHGFENITDWNPGDTIENKVSIKSLGSMDTYVRAKITPKWNGGKSIENVKLNVNKNDWIYNEADGYYYYTNILTKNDETPLLLKSVTLDGESTDDGYQNKTLYIEVDAQAVQTTNGAYKDVWKLDNLPEDMKAEDGTSNDSDDSNDDIAGENSLITFIQKIRAFLLSLIRG